MRKIALIAASIILAGMIAGCNNENAMIAGGAPSTNESTRAAMVDPTLHSPYAYEAYTGMHYSEVERILSDAGFVNITLSPIEDINSNSYISDGTVEEVFLDGSDDYTEETPFNKNSAANIVYHTIPKVLTPMASADAVDKHYMDVGKAFFDAGFSFIETDEVYDLPADSDSETIVTVNDEQFGVGSPLPFDSIIRVIGHYPVQDFSTKIVIDFEENWIFSKYDVVVALDGRELGTLPHGQGNTYILALPTGEYTISFSKQKDQKVSGSAVFEVNSQTEVTYHIACHSDKVSVEEKDYKQELTNRTVLMPYSSSHFLRKDYQTAYEELKKLGFSKVTAMPTPNNLWSPSEVNSVVEVSIDGKSSFEWGTLFKKESSVTLFYHLPDFAFDQSLIGVTEKESFAIPYTLTSGDDIASFTFAVDSPDKLQRNDDGTYTALLPGRAVVTASIGGHTCSSCTVEIAEIVIPVERVVFSTEELNVIVGSNFCLEYTITPENANYRDITIQIAEPIVEENENSTFYVNEPGDTVISFYQDDRQLGACTIHASTIDIEEVIIDECAEEAYIGDTVDLAFKLLPEIATNKGIRIDSSNEEVAEVLFDERGESLAKIIGVSAGKATITITTPDGTQYPHQIEIKEVIPVDIAINNTQPNMRIEVGTPISLDVVWNPDNTSVKELSWKSSDSKVIKVNDDGSLEAVGVGTAEITAKHKAGVTGSIVLCVEPTLATQVSLNTDFDFSKRFHKGESFTIQTSVLPLNATNQGVTFSSDDESVAKVSDKGVVTAVNVGTATITATSADGPSDTLEVVVSPAPQKFRISWSASLIDSNHVGSNWSKSFSVNGEAISSGASVTLDPDDMLTINLLIVDEDSNPDSNSYFEKIPYSEDLCKNGYSVSETLYVRENAGRYSGNSAEWKISITITPVN